MSIIDSLFGFGQMGLQQAFNKKNAATQQGYNLDLQKNSAKLQQENWNKQFLAQNQRQDYLLANQKRIEVEALRAAGLNPALANGQTQLAATSSPVGSSIGTPSAGLPTAPSGLVEGHIGGRQADINKFVGEGQVENLNMSAFRNRAEAIHLLSDIAPNMAKKFAEGELAHEQALSESHKRDWYDSQIEVNAANIEHWSYQNDLFDAQTQAIWEKLDLEKQLLIANEYEARTRGNYNTASAEKARADARAAIKSLAVMDKQIDYMCSQIGLNDAEAENFKALAFETTQNGNLKQFELKVRETLGEKYYAGKEVVNDVIGAVGNAVGAVKDGILARNEYKNAGVNKVEHKGEYHHYDESSRQPRRNKK